LQAAEHTSSGTIETTELLLEHIPSLVFVYCACFSKVRIGQTVRLWSSPREPGTFYIIRCAACGLKEAHPSIEWTW
jgi:hypothetical protein